VNDVIEVRGLRCDAVVGVFEYERQHPQPLTFDLDIERSFVIAAANDDVSSTTNYADVLTLVERVAREGQFFLLETLADRVAAAVLDFDHEVASVEVMVAKLRPPVENDVRTVGVRCRRQR